MGRQPGRTNGVNAMRAMAPYLLLCLALLAAVAVAFAWLPKRYVDAIVPAATFLLVLVTGGLVAATWFYAKRTAESLRMMEQQTRAVELQVAAADRQRGATIRPVIFFRNDRADPEAIARYTEEMKRWKKQQGRWETSSSLPGKSEAPPGEKPEAPGASLVNEGNGVALNVRAWALIADGKRLSEQAASIGKGGSHFVKGWYSDLGVDKAVIAFAATYQDAEETAYWTAVRGMPTDGIWRVGEGPLPSEFEIPEGGPPTAPDTA